MIIVHASVISFLKASAHLILITVVRDRSYHYPLPFFFQKMKLTQEGLSNLLKASQLIKWWIQDLSEANQMPEQTLMTTDVPSKVLNMLLINIYLIHE